jgi:uncharacterized protein YndB with AHSA1/START domain
MNILIIILIVIAAIIAILLIVALIAKKDYVIEEEVTINQPAKAVFDYVKFIKHQEHYNKWVMMDPLVRKTYTGKDATPGFVYTWDSDNKNVGKGEQEIRKITEGERIDSEVRFEKPFKNVAQVYMVTELVAVDQTRVRWGMACKNIYPLNLMNGFITNMLKKDLQTSLTTLKGVLEK